MPAALLLSKFKQPVRLFNCQSCLVSCLVFSEQEDLIYPSVCLVAFITNKITLLREYFLDEQQE